jgi:glutamine amidotransferase
MIDVAIVDHSLGNLMSVLQASRSVGLDAKITSDASEILGARSLVIPGVGAFGDAMQELDRLGLVDPIRTFAGSGRPVLGVCLGLQLFLDESEEFGRCEGLGLARGRVVRFRSTDAEGRRVKIPQVGWNTVEESTAGAWSGTVLDGLASGTYMYFVHSYHIESADPAAVIASTSYGGVTYCSALQVGNVWGVQFHPERSGPAGLDVYRNLKTMISKAEQ